MSIKSFSISFFLSWLVLNNAVNTLALGSQTSQGFLASTSCTEDNDTKMYLWFSNDGKAWYLLNGGPSYKPPSGVCIEPSIFYNQNNSKYYIAYSDARGDGLHFGVAESTDLTAWKFTASVNGPWFPGAAPVWCPEWFVDDDGSIHIVLACYHGNEPGDFSCQGAGGYERIYETHPTDSNLTTWTRPVEIFRYYLDPNVACAILTPFIVKRDGIYNLFYKKNDMINMIYLAQSDNLLSGYVTVEEGNWAGWGHALQPSLVNLGNGRDRMYFTYSNYKMYWSEANENWITWTAPVACTDDQPYLSIGRGTVIKYENQSEIIQAGWRGYAGSVDWGNAVNWDFCENVLECPGVPDENTVVNIDPFEPAPNVTGNASCKELHVYPKSFDNAPDTIELNISNTTDTFNCERKIGICDGNAIQKRGIINMYGGNVSTPTATGDMNGLWIGGGASKIENCDGILNIYGGLMIVSRIAIYNGAINLYGGALMSYSYAAEDFVINDNLAANKINLTGGSLRLIGDRRAEIDANIADSRIIPYYGRGLLLIDYDTLNPGYTTVSAISNLKMAWNPIPFDYQKKVSLNPTLTWSPGDYVQQVNEHRIYFGTSFADVNAATAGNPLGVYKGVSDVNNYIPPGSLDINTTYYWRIDEVNDANVNSPWKGKVWQFTTTYCPPGGTGLVGDFTEDCIVDLYDLKILSHEWLSSNASADIYPENTPDGIVDFSDFAVFANNWLVEEY